MFVRDRMTKDVDTATPDISVSKAVKIIFNKNHSMLPVIDENRRLVGLLTEKLLTEFSPSKATALSVYEINYLLSKTKVGEIMKTSIFTVGPDVLIEDAALILKTNDIGFLPVIEKDGTLVGVLTRGDIFSAFLEIMGVDDKGTRITLETTDSIGIVANISAIITKFGISIEHISNFETPDGKMEVIIALDTLEVEQLLETLEKEGYKILHVSKKM